MLSGPAWFPARHLAPRPTYPRMGDQAVPAGQSVLSLKGGIQMLRLQSPLPERYSSASGDELAGMIASAKAELGARLYILGHHYQRDDVMRWADARGDSFGLSRIAAGQAEAEYIVFCGVHFMAEAAGVLTGDHRQGLLPDLNAGCSMADMADIDQVEDAWDELARVVDVERLVPVTYMNAGAALQAVVGAARGAGGRV